jgi:hypothetical protein
LFPLLGLLAGLEGSIPSVLPKVKGKDLGLVDLSCSGSMEREGLAGIVDKFFSREIFLAETDIEFLTPLAILLTELAVLISIGVGLFVFVPEVLKRYALLFAHLVKVFHRGEGAFFFGNGLLGRNESVSQGGIIKLGGKRQDSACFLKPVEAGSYGPPHDGATLGDLSSGQLMIPVESLNLLELAQG